MIARIGALFTPLLRIDAILTVLFALLLAGSSLFKGLVTDSPLALYLILFAAILLALLRLRRSKFFTSPLAQWLSITLAVIFAISVLQFFFFVPPASIWLAQQGILAPNALPSAYSESSEIQMLGRLCFIAITCFIALCISHSRRLSLIFMQSFLASVTAYVTLAFLIVAPQRFSEYFHFTHGLVNPNHTANFLCVMLLLTLWQGHRWLRQYRSKHLWRGYLRLPDALKFQYLLQLIFISFSCLLYASTLLLTHSRGGIAAGIIAALCFCAILFVKDYQKHKCKQAAEQTKYYWLMRLTPLALVLVLLLLVLVPYGNLFSATLLREGMLSGDRPAIYSATLSMIADHPFFGVGAGNFEHVFPLYRSADASTEGLIDKAHSHYLEFAAEFGLIGFLMVITTSVMLLKTLFSQLSRHQERYGLPALGISIWLLCALHSLIDFPLQIPALAAITLTFLILCSGQSDRHDTHDSAQAA